MKNNFMGIYVHIPFCIRKCNYCDFLSFVADDRAKEAYINALISEIVAKAGKYSDRVVDTIFFGGGTPSSIDAELISKVMLALKSNFKVSAECEATIECNPGTLTLDKAIIYKQAGFNRISFGLQSTDNELLKLIGRIHTYEEFIDSYNTAREAAFDNINIDMMAALPGQTLEGYIDGLNKVIALKPEHISAYSLIVEEGTPLYEHFEEYPDVPDEDTERQMYYATKELLEGYGYNRYEISNYALAHRECKHNVVYWRRGNYLGLGLGAASLMDEVRFKNTSDMAEYISKAGIEPIHCEYEELTIEDAMAEYMFLGLRMMEGVSAKGFYDAFGKDIIEIYGEVINKNIELSLLEVYKSEAGVNYKLTPRGIDISNTVMAEFLL